MVKRIINKPHLFFFGLIPICIIVAFFSGNKTIDLNIDGTYFVTEIKYWCYFSAVFFGLIGLNYFSLVWTKKPPKKWLTITHLFLQILALVFLVTSNNWNRLFNENNSPLFDDLRNSNIMITISFWLNL